MNAKHQSAVAHLKERMSAHPLAVLVAVEIEHLKQLDSLITELEADGKRVAAFTATIADMKAPDEIKSFTKREYWKTGARAVIEKFNAAMKGAA